MSRASHAFGCFFWKEIAMKNVVLYAALAMLAAACASKDPVRTEPPVADRSTPQQPRGDPSRPPPDTTARVDPMVRGDPLKDPSNILSKRSVYFEFDSNAVKDDYRGMIQAHSRYMTTDRKDSRIRIEGNCDERGSREYNLALGQRRAEAVKKVMTVLGVQDGRIETVSFGEEKPMAQGHDEQSWSQNRRADIKYSGE
jgi:peptidoglycan-associated lipoprotein